ncbi:hypothetical protein Hypma_009957 [Hypsizygus marmoreus]|uniref:Uncharacterized protein n=1 Tax=Hypsizygus marmoreus TaxID=39966 RepID=A0A369JUT2_HYPMA|nr:hypothetical protein Hypma_009957 [Hypsizygus marmoreus]
MRSKSEIVGFALNLEYTRLRSEDMNEVEDYAFTDIITVRDSFGKPAFLQHNTPRGQRVFKSQVQKSVCDGIFQEVPPHEAVYIFFWIIDVLGNDVSATYIIQDSTWIQLLRCSLLLVAHECADGAASPRNDDGLNCRDIPMGLKGPSRSCALFAPK